MSNIQEEESPFIEWIQHHGKKLLMGLGGILFLILLLMMLFGSRTKNRVDQYLLAERDFTQSTNLNLQIISPTKWDESIVQLENLMNQHPELSAKYGATLGEIFLIKGEAKEAGEFVERTLQRTQRDQLPFYHRFARTTLLIGEGKYSEALQESLELQREMQLLTEHNEPQERQKQFGELLCGFNLVRIASLQQKLQNPVGEKEAWDDFVSWSGNRENKDIVRSAQIISQTFQDGDATLSSYIQDRKRSLFPPKKA